ncbi:MAG: response regulator [Dissulfuribacterales bacterium]
MSGEEIKKKLLYIEDNFKEPLETDPIYSMFTDSGFDVMVAEDGEKALKKLDKGQYDCIILDIMLPHEGKDIPKDIPRYRTGIYILERLGEGKFPKNTDTPVVVISAIADMEDTRKIREELNPDRYLEKPIHPLAILKAVEEALKQKDK